MNWIWEWDDDLTFYHCHLFVVRNQIKLHRNMREPKHFWQWIPSEQPPALLDSRKQVKCRPTEEERTLGSFPQQLNLPPLSRAPSNPHLLPFDTKTVSSLARRMSSAVEAVMAAPPSERWLEAHRDPLADIYTFSSCVALSDLTGQIIHWDENVTIKSKIYQGTATTVWLLPTWAQEISTWSCECTRGRSRWRRTRSSTCPPALSPSTWTPRSHESLPSRSPPPPTSTSTRTCVPTSSSPCQRLRSSRWKRSCGPKQAPTRWR